MPVTLSPSSVSHGVWQVSVNRTVVVCFSGPSAREQAVRRSHELADLLHDMKTALMSAKRMVTVAIERAIGRRIERHTLAGFDYTARAPERLQPLGPVSLQTLGALLVGELGVRQRD